MRPDCCGEPSCSNGTTQRMLRNPYDWALGMHRNCYCGEPGPNKKDTEEMAALPFEKFMTRPWMVSQTGVCGQRFI